MAPEPDIPAVRAVAPQSAPAGAPPRIEARSPAPADIPASPLPQQRQPATLVSRTDRARNRAAIEKRIGSIRGVLDELGRRNLAGVAKDDQDRAAAMVDLAETALKRGDLRQADDLSSRAAILANALMGSR